MSIFELIAQADESLARQQVDGAIALYANWLLANPDTPYLAVVCFNLGVCYGMVGNHDAATQAYRIALEAGSIEAGINFGLLREQAGFPEEAIAIWQTVLDTLDTDPAIQPDQYRCGVLNNLGRVRENLGLLQEAESALARSLALQADQPPVWNHLIYLRQQLCLWPVTDRVEGLSRLFVTNARQMLQFPALIDDPEHQARVLVQWLNTLHTPHAESLEPAPAYTHDRIHLGYLWSGDICAGMPHPLTLLDRHDPARYRVYFFVRSGQDIQPLSAPVRHIFMDPATFPDKQAAQIIRQHEIDILVDVAGYHQNLFDYRPAPLQLRYPGSAGCLDDATADYLIAAPYLQHDIPPAKHLCLPPIGGDNADLRARSTALQRQAMRRTCGLPESGIVFCYAGDSWRITESWFALWLQLLDQVSDSVLWLLVRPSAARSSMLAVAVRSGFDGQRLVMADATEDCPLFLADIFLDTYPASADTSSLEALRQGVPVLTCVGKSPASRRTGALLDTLGVPELITTSQATYRDTAVRIVSNPGRLAILQAYLDTRRAASLLFDASHWVRQLENLYEQVWAREMAGLDASTAQFVERPEPKPFFSVVVVHYEGSVSRQEAVRCLQSLYHQKYQNFEILFLHDGPRTQPWETDEFPPPGWIRLKTHATTVRANDYGHSLRDLGIRLARGQYLLITNADNYHYTGMLSAIHQEIMRPYPRVVIHDIDRTAADIIIFGILAKGYMSMGTHENLIDFREFNMDMAARQWMYLSGYPSIMKNIDCMQFVMRRVLWIKEGGWHIKYAQAADGLLFQEFVRKYGVRYVVGPLAEHL